MSTSSAPFADGIGQDIESYPRPAREFFTTCATGWRIPLLLEAPSAVPLLHPIFSSIARPRFSAPISGAEAPTTSPSMYETAPPTAPRLLLIGFPPSEPQDWKSRRFNLLPDSRWSTLEMVLRVYEGVCEVLTSTGNRAGPLPRDCDFRFKVLASSWIVFRWFLVMGGSDRLGRVSQIGGNGENLTHLVLDESRKVRISVINSSRFIPFEYLTFKSASPGSLPSNP